MLRLKRRPSPDARTVLFVVTIVSVAICAAALYLRSGDGEREPENTDQTHSGTVPTADLDRSEESEEEPEPPTLKHTVPVITPVDQLRETIDGSGQPRLSDVREASDLPDDSFRYAIGELVEAGEVKAFPVGDVIKIQSVA